MSDVVEQTTVISPKRYVLRFALALFDHGAAGGRGLSGLEWLARR